MTHNEAERALRFHAAKYPLMQPQDAVKLCYQMEYGPGHMVASAPASLDRLRAECAVAQAHGLCAEPLFEPVGEALVRLQLASLGADAPTLSTINKAFAYTAGAAQGSAEGMEGRLCELEALCAQRALPFTQAALRSYLESYREQGLPMVSHSDIYRRAYAPAYRVLLSAFAWAWPLLIRIDRALACQERVILAIDGNSGAGKSTLAALLGNLYGANVLHMDDFFLPPQRKTEARLAEAGGNVDYERFLEEVVEPLIGGQPFCYRPYDCQEGNLAAPVAVTPGRLSIVEGVYSMHPALRHGYTLSAFCAIPPKEQSARILRRGGAALHERFVNEWIPLENHYFETLGIRELCDVTLQAGP